MSASRLASRLVTWACLLSFVLSAFSTAAPASITSAAPASVINAAPPLPASVPPRPLAAIVPMTPPPTPSNTGSTGLPASAITDLRDQYGSRHTVHSALEVDFPEARTNVFNIPGTIDTTPPDADVHDIRVSATYRVPRGTTFSSVVASYTM